jgi:4-carboxymuconolactone decarboxylase
MPDPNETLGGRLPLAERAALSPDQERLFARMTESVVPWAESHGFSSRTDDGRFIGPFNPALLSPVISGSFLDFQAAEERDTSLPERVRQVVILAVGAVWESADGLPAELSASEQAAWRFAHQLTGQRRISRQVYEQAEAAFGTRGIADMLHLIGAYQTVCGLLNAFEVPAPR